MVDIYDNAPGCGSPPEVASACGYTMPCLPYGNYYLLTQSDVDNFQADYPGCTSLNGTVYISGSLISDLTGLSAITSIEGDLVITENTILANLSGLEGLTSLTGDLQISNNVSLSSLSGLDNLTEGSVENLFIYDNQSLTECDIQGICQHLSSPNGIVDIHDNASGCNYPHEIAAACGFTMPCLPYGNYYFFNQVDIDNFQSNYPGCNQWAGLVLISGSDITDLSTFSGITAMDGDLEIINNANLTTLNGLEGLTSVSGNLSIGAVFSGNPRLVNLSGLYNITTVGGDLSIRDNDSLVSLTGLDALITVDSSLEIIRNPDLFDLQGLDALTSIGQTMVLKNNFGLTSLNGLESLTSVGGDLSISTNTLLSSLASLQGLTSVGKILSVGFCNGLTDLEGLEGVTSITDLTLIYNSNLVSLAGLDNLVTANGSCWIGNNDNLAGLEQLESLTSIGGSLKIDNNGALASLSGLDDIAPGTITDLTIMNNESLSACAVQSICDYLASPNGIVEISANASGCATVTEVEEACETLDVKESSVGSRQSSVSVYPNPTQGISDFRFLISDLGRVTLKIYDLHGREIATVVDEVMPAGEHVVSFDAEKLLAGVYVFMKTEVRSQKSETGKMIKF
jgi:hypothetical protein